MTLNTYIVNKSISRKYVKRGSAPSFTNSQHEDEQIQNYAKFWSTPVTLVVTMEFALLYILSLS